MEAVKSKNPEKVLRFLEMAPGFVDINSRDSNGYTALCYAAREGDKAMIEFLLKNGANVNTTMSSEYLPVHFAAQLAGHDNLDERFNGYAMIKILKAAGADLSKVNNSGKNAFHLCNAQNQFMEAVKSKNPEKVFRFLEMAPGFVDINNRDSNGWTALCYAAYTCDKAMVEFLLKNGANANTAMRGGELPVHYAARLAASVNVAEKETGYAILRSLKSAGADLHARNNNSETAYSIGKLQDHLLQTIPAQEPSKGQDLAATAASVKSGASQNLQHGMFAPKRPEDKLYSAVKQGLFKKVKKYLDNGIDCNYNYPGTQHITLVNYLISDTKLDKNQLDILDLLIKNSADLSICDAKGNSPMEIIFNRQDISLEIREQATSMLVDNVNSDTSNHRYI